MRHVPAHPASPYAAGHNGEASLVTDLSLDEPDVVEALALGARRVLIGRPTLSALATVEPPASRRFFAGSRWNSSVPWRSAVPVRSAPSTTPFAAGLRVGARTQSTMTTVAAMLAARANDDHIGVMDANGRWTWRECAPEGAARGALARSMIGHELPHIGVLLPNGPEYLFWLNAGALAGAAIVGINPTRRGEALAADIRATDCALVIVTDAGGRELLGLSLHLDEDRILVCGDQRYASPACPFRCKRRGTGADRTHRGRR